MDPTSRFRDAIQRSTVAIDDIARQSNISKPWIYGLMSYRDEWEINLSLKNLRSLSGIVGVSALWLLDGTEQSVEKKDDRWLYVQILKYLERTGCSLSELEDHIGYALKNDSNEWVPSNDFNLDCLQNLAKTLQFDWRAMI